MVSANGYSPLSEEFEVYGFRDDARELLNALPFPKASGFPLRPNFETRASIDITVRRIIEVELMEEAAELGRLT